MRWDAGLHIWECVRQFYYKVNKSGHSRSVGLTYAERNCLRDKLTIFPPLYEFQLDYVAHGVMKVPITLHLSSLLQIKFQIKANMKEKIGIEYCLLDESILTALLSLKYRLLKRHAHLFLVKYDSHSMKHTSDRIICRVVGPFLVERSPMFCGKETVNFTVV